MRFGGLSKKERKDHELDEEIASHLRDAQRNFIRWWP